jgi:hypothetical protein
MICKIQVVVMSGGGRKRCELAYLERTDSKSETLGLTVAQGKVIESRLRSSHWRNPRWSSLVVTASDGK